MALIGLVEMILGIIVVLVLFGIHLRGNLGLLFLAAIFFLFSILSIGFLISLVSQSQQQALFFAWFTMILFLMLSGLLTPKPATSTFFCLVYDDSLPDALRSSYSCGKHPLGLSVAG